MDYSTDSRQKFLINMDESKKACEICGTVYYELWCPICKKITNVNV